MHGRGLAAVLPLHSGTGSGCYGSLQRCARKISADMRPSLESLRLPAQPCASFLDSSCKLLTVLSPRPMSRGSSGSTGRASFSNTVPDLQSEVTPSLEGPGLKRCPCGALFPLSMHRHCCSVCSATHGASHNRRCSRLQRTLLREGYAPRRFDRICRNEHCQRAVGNGFRTCCSYCQHGSHSRRCDMDAGQVAGSNMATGFVSTAGLGTVAPWTTPAPSLSQEEGQPLGNTVSEGQGLGALISEAAPLRECTLASNAQLESQCTASERQHVGPIASSSDEVSEIRLGSDFLQQLD